MIVGVLGAGTMGAGIAQLAAASGADTLLYDPDKAALARGIRSIGQRLAREVEKGRLAAGKAGMVEAAEELDELIVADIVIEAAPESLELKRNLFGRVAGIVRDDCVLASNTSSLSVTEIAAGVPVPERVVGMHFFNPAPVMKLVEVVAGERSGEAALQATRELGRAMERHVIDAADGPGFLVNRCGRPFSLEALRIVQEGLASFEQVDRICRLGGGFRMGPFELMDLVGIDVGFEVAKSFNELSFGEPRWRPSPIQARMVAAGRLGRKTGRGYYEYADDRSYRPEDPQPPSSGTAESLAVAILGDGPVAEGLRERARSAGHELREGGPVELAVDAGPQPHPSPPGGAPLIVLCAAQSLAARGERGAVGFHLLPPLDEAKLVELTRLPTTQAFACEAAERFFAGVGFLTEWVEDAPGLVLGRIVSQLVNEAAFAIGEGVGSADDVDTGLTLGLSHPRGPVAWSEAIGLEHVLAVLDGLSQERREERYRAAPLLRRARQLARGLRD